MRKGDNLFSYAPFSDMRMMTMRKTMEKKMKEKGLGDNLFPDAPAVTQPSAAEHCSVFTAFKLLIRKCQPSLPRCNK